MVGRLGGLVVWVLASSFGLASCFFVVDSALLCCSAWFGFFADLGPNHCFAYEFGESLDGCFFCFAAAICARRRRWYLVHLPPAEVTSGGDLVEGSLFCVSTTLRRGFVVGECEAVVGRAWGGGG